MTATMLELSSVAAGGAALGAAHFLGLWWTVRRLPKARCGGMLVLASGVLRTAVTMTGLWLLMAGNPVRLLVAMAAFLTLRVLLGVQLREPDAVRSR